MKIEVPKIIKKIRLDEYAPEFGEATLEVWVNAPNALLEEINATSKRMLEIIRRTDLNADEEKAAVSELTDLVNEQLRLYSVLLSQGSEESRMSQEELKVMVEQVRETDPNFWPWLKEAIAAQINLHRYGRKKV